MVGSEILWWLNCFSFLGILVLSVPTWSLNFRRKKLQKIKDADKNDSSGNNFRSKVRAISRRKREEGVAEWRRVDQVCLFVGYLLLLGSSASRLFV